MFDHFHIHFDADKIIKKLNHIMATQAELAQQLRDLKTQNDKSRDEQLAKLQELQDAIDAGGGTTPEVDAALAELKASIQTDDDLNADAMSPEGPTE